MGWVSRIRSLGTRSFPRHVFPEVTDVGECDQNPLRWNTSPVITRSLQPREADSRNFATESAGLGVPGRETGGGGEEGAPESRSLLRGGQSDRVEG